MIKSQSDNIYLLSFDKVNTHHTVLKGKIYSTDSYTDYCEGNNMKISNVIIFTQLKIKILQNYCRNPRGGLIREGAGYTIPSSQISIPQNHITPAYSSDVLIVTL